MSVASGETALSYTGDVDFAEGYVPPQDSQEPYVSDKSDELQNFRNSREFMYPGWDTVTSPEDMVPVVDSVRWYSRTIGKVALLTASQETDLAKRIEAGLLAGEKLAAEPAAQSDSSQLHDDLRQLVREGEQAKDFMLKTNLPLVISLAKRYIGHGLELPDLIQEGNLGLMHALKKFDYTKGFKLSTYADRWIRNAIIRGIADQAPTIRIPIDIVDDMKKTARVRRELSADLNCQPTDQEVAEASGLSPDRVMQLEGYRYSMNSLDQPLSDAEGGEDATFGSLIHDADQETTDDIVLQAIDEEERAATVTRLSGAIKTALGSLTEQEAAIFRRRNGTGDQPTLSELAAEFDLERTIVRRSLERAISRLRHPTLAYLFEAAGVPAEETIGFSVQGAQCAGADPSVFYPAAREDATAAKQLCADCPLRSACLEGALKRKELTGTWGGLNTRERQRLLKVRSGQAPVAA